MFIFLRSDDFEAASFGNAADTAFTQQVLSEEAPIRRPYRGIQVKKDTYAVISVRDPNGEPIPLVSSSAIDQDGIGMVNEYSDFILQSVQDSRQEKTQVIETFGEAFVYFFGEKPRFVTFSGLLMNTEDFNWRAQFWHNYERYLRGTKLVQRNARCYISYDTIVIEGYPISAAASDSADDPYTIPFQMSVLMTNYHEFSNIGVTRFPGDTAVDYEVANQELMEQRSKFVSVGVEVRRANLNSALNKKVPTGKSALSFLREVTDPVNEAYAWLGSKLDIAASLMSGRVMRVPLGVAGYYAAINAERSVSASVGEVTSNSEIVVDVNGVKVKIPGPKIRVLGKPFGPGWKSKVTRTSRGMIYENIDEYPTRQPPSLESLLSPADRAKYNVAKGRAMRADIDKARYAILNVAAEGGGVMQKIAEVVSSIRTGFTMLSTARNFVADPLAVVGSTLGVTPQDVKKLNAGLTNPANLTGMSSFLGSTTKNVWESWGDRISKASIVDVTGSGLLGPGAAKIGDVYNQAEYEKNSAGDIVYESVYGDKDYSGMLDPTSGSLKKVLDEAYGDTDGSSGIGGDSDVIEGTYGSSADTITPSEEDRTSSLDAANNPSLGAPQTEDVSGINVPTDDTIEPVA